MPTLIDESTPQTAATTSEHHVVIIGGGFGGLYAAQTFGKLPVRVTVIDRRNFHLFQPLLYQVATGRLSPGDIASPLRAILSRQKNTQVLLGNVQDIDPQAQTVRLERGVEIAYDSLIVATGVSYNYFGNDHWADIAPGMKTVEDALEVRRRIFTAFEAAEKETDPEKRAALLRFVIVGGGPTGVELAGALAELAFQTMKSDFRNIDTSETEILLVEGMDRVLPPFPPELSAEARRSLEQMGVTVLTNTLVTKIEGDQLTLRQGQQDSPLQASTVLWAAGVRASKMGKVLAERTGAELDRVGRVIVESDLSVPNHPNIFVIGDLAHFAHQDNRPLPGVAPVAMQAGQYVAQLIGQRLVNQPVAPFTYKDTGSLAIIGRNRAVVNLGWIKLSGFPAWLLWLFVHIYYLIEFDNKLVVMTQWLWNYVTRKQGVRLITEPDVKSGVTAPEAPASTAQS